jgi:hypothetical protein
LALPAPAAALIENTRRTAPVSWVAPRAEQSLSFGAHTNSTFSRYARSVESRTLVRRLYEQCRLSSLSHHSRLRIPSQVCGGCKAVPMDRREVRWLIVIVEPIERLLLLLQRCGRPLTQSQPPG